eukprot:674421-Prorocentrum_minimum.AAC.1
MTRGLWQYHREHLAKGGLDYLRESTVARYPTLRAMVYLHQMGITIANPGEEDSAGREHTTLRRAIQKEVREWATRKWKNPTLANLMGS